MGGGFDHPELGAEMTSRSDRYKRVLLGLTFSEVDEVLRCLRAAGSRKSEDLSKAHVYRYRHKRLIIRIAAARKRSAGAPDPLLVSTHRT